jgi:hypothetical protein
MESNYRVYFTKQNEMGLKVTTTGDGKDSTPTREEVSKK